MARSYKTSEILTDDNLDALIAKLKQLEGVVENLTTAVKKEETAAAELETTTKTLTATTANGREQILKNVKASEDVERAHKAYSKVLAEENAKVQELKIATATLTNLKKNEAKAALSAEGSYNKLSAQYSIMKLALNAMSKAEREGTEAGRQLVKTANATYQEMKRLQEVTGKHVLSVGDYAKATHGLNQNLGEMKKDLMALRNMSFTGKTEEEVAQINKEIGRLVDNMEDLKAQQKALGTEMSTLFVGSLKVVAAGVEGLVGTLSLLGVESETIQNLERKMLQLVAVTHALSEIEDALQKKTIQTTIARIQSGFITAKDTAIKWASTTATIAATRAENAKTIALARGNIATRAAAAATYIWNTALTFLAANPVVAVIIGVAALAAGIVYLTSRMGESAEMTKKLTTELNNLAGQRDSLEEWQQFQNELFQEMGIEGSKLTKKQRLQTNERIALIEKEISALGKLSSIQGLSDEQAEKQKGLFNELKRLQDQKILFNIREANQTKKEAEEAAKLAEDRAKKARAENERIKKDREAKLKDQQDFQLAEMQAEIAFQIALYDVQTDYGNQSAEYQRQRAGERLLLEQELNRALLDAQLQFGRISTRQYETALLQQETALKEFSARITQERNLEAPTALPGIDLSKRNEEKAKKRFGEIMQGLRDKAVTELQKKDEAFSIYDLLGIDISDKGKEQVKSSFDFAKGQLSEYLAFRTQIANRNVQNADREVQAAQNALDQEMQNRRDGLADLVETRAKDLEDAKQRQAEALKQQERTAKAERAIQTIQQATNLITGISKLFAEKNILAIPLAALMLGSFIGFKLAAVGAAKKEFAEGDYQVLRGGSHASGNDVPLGTHASDGRPEYAEGGEARMILSKRSTRKYKSVLPQIFHSLKKGTFEMEFTRQANAARDLPLVMNVGQSSHVSMGGVENRLGKLIEQGRNVTLMDSKGRPKTVVRGNLTTVYKYSD